MDLPVKFPSETQVILEDVARFRALNPRDHFRAIQSLLSAGDHIRRISPKAAWAQQYAEEQELLTQRNIREFIARHGYGLRAPVGNPPRVSHGFVPPPDVGPGGLAGWRPLAI
jgi:hypothetical protein